MLISRASLVFGVWCCYTTLQGLIGLSIFLTSGLKSLSVQFVVSVLVFYRHHDRPSLGCLFFSSSTSRSPFHSFLSTLVRFSTLVHRRPLPMTTSVDFLPPLPFSLSLSPPLASGFRALYLPTMVSHTLSRFCLPMTIWLLFCLEYGKFKPNGRSRTGTSPSLFSFISRNLNLDPSLSHPSSISSPYIDAPIFFIHASTRLSSPVSRSMLHLCPSLPPCSLIYVNYASNSKTSSMPDLLLFFIDSVLYSHQNALRSLAFRHWLRYVIFWFFR